MKHLLKANARKLYAHIPGKRMAFEALRGLRVLPPSIYEHLHFQGPFKVPLDKGRSFTTYNEPSFVETVLFWGGLHGSWEPTSMQVWKSLCDGQDGLLLDVGANTGAYALIAAAVAPKGKVIAFEPLSRLCRLLDRNLALNDFDVEVVEAAVTSASGTVFIADDVGHELNYSASIEGQGNAARTYPVRAITIDDFVGERRLPVAAIKIDVERHEPQVLEGSRRTIVSSAPPILIEVLDHETAERCEAVLGDTPYERFNIIEGTGMRKAPRLRAPEGSNWNWLLCTPEQISERGLEPHLLR